MISFTFTNNSGIEYNSLTYFGIYLSEKPAFPRAERNIRHIEIEGRQGSLSEDLKTYKNVEITLNCSMLNTDIPNEILDDLNEWLNGEGGKLTFSYFLDKYYKVKQVMSYEIKESSGILGEFEVTFLCEPFRYVEANPMIFTTQNPVTIGNGGNFESEPYIKVSGNGNITLTINSKDIVLTDVVDYIEIDSEMQNCYKSTQFTNNQMLGEFPVFGQSNTISWVGNVTQIEIISNWRCV